MFAFGCAITDRGLFEHAAGRGLELVAEPDSEILAYESAGTLFRNYNLLIDRVAGRDDLETLVLLHQDAEIVDANFCEVIREALRDPEVALVGCAGAIGVRSIAWWEGSVTWAGFTHRYQELGGGEIAALTWDRDAIPATARLGEVEMLDGFVLALSPWAIENLRFDESLGQALHGYDFDICMQARAAGRKVVTADFRAIHHHSLSLVSDVEGWVESHVKLSEKWHDQISGPDGAEIDWRRRARRAEAERGAARAQATAAQLLSDARARELQRELDSIKHSASWRLTAPLRRLAQKLGRHRRGDSG